MNLLIPVDSANSIMFQKLNHIKNSYVDSGPKAEADFYKSVLDRKYFLREEGGKQYFKLPLVTLYNNALASEAGDAPSPAGGLALDAMEYVGASDTSYTKTPSFKDSPWPFLDFLGDNIKFNEFVNSIQYKSLLSFLSILVAEVTEARYPRLNNLFDNTLETILTALNTFLSTANRDKDPNFYQDQHFNTDDAAAAGFSMDWVMMILEMLLKTLANATDPTWKTPWFFIGPLTPIGIIAKILDSEGDTDSNATEDIDNKLAEGIDCSD